MLLWGDLILEAAVKVGVVGVWDGGDGTGAHHLRLRGDDFGIVGKPVEQVAQGKSKGGHRPTKPVSPFCLQLVLILETRVLLSEKAYEVIISG